MSAGPQTNDALRSKKTDNSVVVPTSFQLLDEEIVGEMRPRVQEQIVAMEVECCAQEQAGFLDEFC